MRKLFFTLLLSLTALTSSAQMIKLGDIDRDDILNVADVTALVDIILNGYTSSAQMIKLGDVDRDDILSVADVTALVDIILNGYSPFSLSPTEVTMQVGGTSDVTISGGYDVYEVESANPDIVTASLNGLTVTLTAVAGGETTVTVKDVLTFRTIDIPVVVNYESLQVSSNELSLIAGERGAVEINTGSGYYSVLSSDENVATAVMEGSSVVVTAVGGGTATITVTDTNSDQSATITVTVYFPLTLSASSLKLIIGDEETVNITSGNGSFTVVSSDTGVATAKLVESSVNVTAVGAGTAAVTVTDCLSGETAAIEVQSFLTCPDDHHPHLINLGLPSGTKWACCNVDTDYPENQKPENYGGYYASGETETKTLYYAQSYQHYNGGFQILGSDIAGTEYDVAHVKWGGSWVIPSKEQQEELVENCTYEWTTMNGVKGGKFTSKINGCTIFLPAAGLRKVNGLYVVGSYGYYWSSTQNPLNSARAFSFIFSSNSAYLDVVDRFNGHTVRPVSK